MKRIICTAVSALALAAFADGVNSTEFGVLTVPSSAEETIISVPWLASGTGDDPVKVCDLVLTAGLNSAAPGVKADELKYYDGSSWYAWVLTQDGDVKKWVNSDTKTADTPVVRGRALILKRPTASARADKFYIMGKPTSGSNTIELPAGVYTLIAPTQVDSESVAINSLTWTGMESTKDYLYVPTDNGGMVIYRWIVSKGSSTGTWMRSDTGATDGTIIRGKGAWFYTKGSGSKSVTFN